MIYKISTKFKKYITVESAKDFLKEIDAIKDEITSLDLSMNTYGLEVMKEICKKISEMDQLKDIRLESIFDSLTHEEVTEVFSHLSKSLSRSLETFELPSNAVSCNFPEEFGLFLQECPLKKLNLHDCGLGEDGLKNICKYLDKLEIKNKLECINISKNRINKIDPIFGEVLKKFKNIREVITRNNTIEEESMAKFIDDLKSLNKLEILDLSDNFVCGKAIEHLSRLYETSNINELYLQDAKMDIGDINILLNGISRYSKQELPGGYENIKPTLTLDISCLYFEQDTIEILTELAKKIFFKKLVIFENDYKNIEELRKIIEDEGGLLIDEEETKSEDFGELENDLIEKIRSL